MLSRMALSDQSAAAALCVGHGGTGTVPFFVAFVALAAHAMSGVVFVLTAVWDILVLLLGSNTRQWCSLLGTLWCFCCNLPKCQISAVQIWFHPSPRQRQGRIFSTVVPFCQGSLRSVFALARMLFYASTNGSRRLLHSYERRLHPLLAAPSGVENDCISVAPSETLDPGNLKSRCSSSATRRQ